MTIALPLTAAAQSSLWVDASLSSARPPAGAVDAGSSNYGVFGARASAALSQIKLDGIGSAGRAFDASDGRWHWLQLDATHAMGSAGAFLLDYREAFKYRIGGAQLQPQLTLLGGLLAIRPSATLAKWQSDSLSSSFAVVGARAELNRGFGPLFTRFSAEAHSAGENGYAAGTYASAGADVFGTIGETSLGAGLVFGENPIESETGFQLWTSHGISEKLRVDAQISRPLTDAVFGSPGTLGFTVSFSYRLAHRRYQPPQQLALVGEPNREGRSVRFTVTLKEARSVAVSGTFSDWEPVPLTKKGDIWSGEIVVEPGTHQYGFLVDGENWYLPSDAVGVIDDGFGRKNATLVVGNK